jgi:acetyl-CoA acetyltransferase
MLQTAENVAAEAKVSREEQDEITLLRYAQYQDSLRDDRAFQKRYMQAVELGRGKKAVVVDADEGVFPTTREGLAALRPVLDGGSVTFGSQTHPADGNAGLLVVNEARRAALDPGAPFRVQVLAFGDARVEKAMMPMAPVPAARAALSRAGLGFDDLAAIKTHNPFAVNDAYFARETGVKLERMNRFGSPLVYGHPQGPTGLRAIIELIEELSLLGGGHGLFTGCAAGDTAMAVVIKVS